MPCRIETYYPGAGMFMPTNHTSDDLDQLKALADGETSDGFRYRIVDSAGQTVYEPEPCEREGHPSIEDIASMLDVPIIQPDELDDFVGG